MSAFHPSRTSQDAWNAERAELAGQVAASSEELLGRSVERDWLREQLDIVVASEARLETLNRQLETQLATHVPVSEFEAQAERLVLVTHNLREKRSSSSFWSPARASSIRDSPYCVYRP